MNRTTILPAEIDPQAGLWLSWPGNPSTWPQHRAQLETDYADFVREITLRQPVDLICASPWWPTAESRLLNSGVDLSRITRHDWPTNDAWCRDHGPLFVQTKNGPAIVDMPYNAWGGKFPPWDFDNDIPRRVSEHRNLPRIPFPIFGEGGAIEINRTGVLLTTESVWLNPNRNPGLTRDEAEAHFREYLGVQQTIWLPGGLLGDDTDGHIDTMSRFADDRTVVSSLPDPGDPNYPGLKRNVDILRENFTVVPLPHPAPLLSDNSDLLPATYANYLILNEAVLVPTYAQPKRDKQALGILQDLFSGRNIVGIPSETFIHEGGGPHCLSMQEPLLDTRRLDLLK